jgi:hypothetical protein
LMLTIKEFMGPRRPSLATLPLQIPGAWLNHTITTTPIACTSRAGQAKWWVQSPTSRSCPDWTCRLPSRMHWSIRKEPRPRESETDLKIVLSKLLLASRSFHDDSLIDVLQLLAKAKNWAHANGDDTHNKPVDAPESTHLGINKD